MTLVNGMGFARGVALFLEVGVAMTKTRDHQVRYKSHHRTREGMAFPFTGHHRLNGPDLAVTDLSIRLVLPFYRSSIHHANGRIVFPQVTHGEEIERDGIPQAIAPVTSDPV